MFIYAACAVDSTSEVIRVSAREQTETRSTNISLPHINVVPVEAPGVPARSLALMQFAEQVAASLPESPDFSENWMNELVDNFARFND